MFCRILMDSDEFCFFLQDPIFDCLTALPRHQPTGRGEDRVSRASAKPSARGLPAATRVRGRSRDTEGLREHGMMMDEQDRESEAGSPRTNRRHPVVTGVRPLSPDESTASVPGPISSLSFLPLGLPLGLHGVRRLVGSPASVSPLRWTRRPVDAVIERRRRAKAHVEREEFFSPSTPGRVRQLVPAPRISEPLQAEMPLPFQAGRHQGGLGDDAILIHPPSPTRSTSGFHLGSALYAVGDYSNAARAFQEAPRRSIPRRTGR